MGTSEWSTIPDTPGVYVIFDRGEVIYVGMAGRDGKGSLRRRLRDHASGQVVNMFAQYLLFSRILDPKDLPRSPQEAGKRCRSHIQQYCSVRVWTAPDGKEARIVEAQLREKLHPTLNGLKPQSTGAI
jgi:excinuclease UvrABC nuclease subunit